MEKYIILSLKNLNINIFKLISKKNNDLGLDITPVQSRVIISLYENEDLLCQKDLEQLICRNKSTLSSILDTLEKKGYIIRGENKNDSRKKTISLTDKAYYVIDVLHNNMKSIGENIIEGISLEEYKIFCNVIEKINQNIERI